MGRLVGGGAERALLLGTKHAHHYTPTLGGHLGRDGVDALALSRSLPRRECPLPATHMCAQRSFAAFRLGTALGRTRNRLSVWLRVAALWVQPVAASAQKPSLFGILCIGVRCRAEVNSIQTETPNGQAPYFSRIVRQAGEAAGGAHPRPGRHRACRAVDGRLRSGTTTLGRLLELTREVDFAAFVFARDDWTGVGVTASNELESAQASPRDNVVFEAGLFGGVLGMRRTFILHAKGAKLPATCSV